MTPALMLYSLLIAALIGGAAWMSERLVAEFKRPRRFIWLAAMLLSLGLPIYGVLNAPDVELRPIVDAQAAIRTGPVDAPVFVASVPSSAIEIREPLLAWPDFGQFSLLFAVVWIGSSAVICAFHAVSWLALRRELARAERRHIEGVDVRILDDYGPAVFGFASPEIILPRWLLDANDGLRQIVLHHEREHIAARDHAVLVAALFLVAVAPWNLPLWWQLRRLRLATEVDCDARLLRSEIRDTAYAEALLEVQQRQAKLPIAAVALIEPASKLERRIRIMLSRQSPCRRTVVGTCALAAGALVIAACAVNPPEAGLLQKPPTPYFGENAPAGPLKDVARVIAQRYGTELRPDDPRIAVVDLHFDESGTLMSSAFERKDQEPVAAKGKPGTSGFLALCAYTLLGENRRCDIDPATNLLRGAVQINLYGSASSWSDGGQTEEIDRRIAERYFADIFSAPPPENSGYWVLLDNAGKPLAAGREALRTPFSEAGPPFFQIDAALRQRYSHVEIEKAQTSPIKDRQSRVVTDRAGRNLALYTGWLSADSPPLTATP